MTPIVRTVAWLAGLAASLVALVALGTPIPPPPVHDIDALTTWLQHTDPAVATFSILRVVVLGVVAYLLVSTLVLLAAQTSRVPAFVATASRFAAPAVRGVVRGAVGAGLAGTIAATATPALAATPTPRAHVLIDASTTFAAWSTDPVDTLAPVPTGPTRAAPDDLTLVHLGPAPSDPTTSTTSTTSSLPPAPTTAPSTTAPPTTTPPPTTTRPNPSPPPPLILDLGPTPPASVAGPPPAPSVTDAAATPVPELPVAPIAPDADPVGGHDHEVGAHTIVTGDHLWGVAEQTLAAAWSDPPRPDQTATYLQRLIAENRSVLVVPDDPDLVLPGQVFVLPVVGPR